jgi:hypothetical protein
MPAGPPPITTTSKGVEVSFMLGQLTFPATFSSPRRHRAFRRFARRKAATADVQSCRIPDSTVPCCLSI